VIELLAFGALVGVVLGLTGAGGSILAVPLLMFGMHWSLTQAAPVALIAVAASAAVGTALGLRARIVRYRAATLMALCGALTTPLGLMLAHHVPLKPLTVAFGVVLAWVGVRQIRLARAPAASHAPGAAQAAPCLLDPATGRLHWTGRCGRALSLAGLATGALSGLFGVGGGFVIVPTLTRYTDLSSHAVVATSMMVVMLVAGAGVVAAGLSGHLPLEAAWPFALGAGAGMIAARSVASRLSGPGLQVAFGLLTCAVAIGIEVRAWMG
jgi:uncharacterized membrane protein YfcA